MLTMFVRAELGDLSVGDMCFVGVDSNLDVRHSVSHVFLKGTTLVARKPDGSVVLGWKPGTDELPVGIYTATTREVFDQLFPRVTNHVSNLLDYSHFILLSPDVTCYIPPDFMQKKEKTLPGIDAMICNRCQEPVLQAAPNQSDGSFRCYSCKTNPFR